jgi:succinate-semialdehyde dehydrogenase/glutarate-semialdehyde dehydrogenase
LPANNNLKNFLPAAVLTGVDHTMDIMREETFGPVVGVMKFGRIEEAINLANDSSLGLTGSVWSRDRQKAEKIGRQLQAGVITINDHLMTHGMPATPWGGFKESSIGRGHGEIGFKEMTQTQVVVQDLLHFAKRNPWWHPYSKKEYLGIKGNMQALYSKNLWQRISGLINFIKIVPAMFSVDSKRSDNSEKK